MTEKSFKKIVATYDALPKLMECIPNYKDYFLLIDEYHLLFNDYSFRGEIIKCNYANQARKERTDFRGPHYVECYVIRNGICVAKAKIDVPIE